MGYRRTSCSCHGKLHSLIEKQLQNNNINYADEGLYPKSCRIWIEISSALVKSIICAVVGWIFRFSKMSKITKFFVKKKILSEKNQ